jgi:tRNA1Val (adenine37-N6)-methyltransferase
MSNSWFQFKQFTIHQDKSAMKVTTDACIQGAWTPVLPQVTEVLDIGAGTGLLSLMLAQRAPLVQVDAVELDKDCMEQAAENIAASPWKDKIAIHNADIRYWQNDKQYELIICNPPFFNNSLLGDNDRRNNVRHTLSLSYNDLLAAMDRLLVADGYISILLPATEHGIWEQLIADAGWKIYSKLCIAPREAAEPNRIVSLAGRNATKQLTEMYFPIRGAEGYTPAFTELMRPYYLKL